ncbi:MAG: ABC transporter ATP-binding protein [Bacillota bacterium]
MLDVSVKHVKFSYDEHEVVLGDIDFHVKAGDFVCILGQSGCGKSTFLRLMAGLEKPTQGSIFIGGKPLQGASLQRIVVFQDYGLFPWMKAGENIVLALKQRFPQMDKKTLKQTTIDALRRVGLSEDVYYKFPKELSGGMKQRCAIARAFSVDPPILLMDEPFGALDAVTRARLQDLVLTMWAKDEKKKTVFFVTHDVDEALLLANRIVVFGQSPSHIIYDYGAEDGTRPTRNTMYDDVKYMRLRNELIKCINSDINSEVNKDI